MLLAVTTAGYLTSSFLSGRILRVLPIGSVLALSTAAAATALLGYALTPVWPVMVALGFLAGLGGGAIDAGLNAYGASHFSARTLNWLHAFFGLGTTAGPLIVTAVLGAGARMALELRGSRERSGAFSPHFFSDTGALAAGCRNCFGGRTTRESGSHP